MTKFTRMKHQVRLVKSRVGLVKSGPSYTTTQRASSIIMTDFLSVTRIRSGHCYILGKISEYQPRE